MSEEIVENAEEVAEVTEVAEVAEVTEEATTESKAFVDSMLEAMTDDEVKSHKMWENLKGKDADELGRYIKELKSFSGKKGDIPKPINDGGTEEEWNAFYEKLGRPESPDGYEFEMSQEFKDLVGEGAPFYEEALGWFKEQAFEAGYSVEKADKLVDGYFDLIAEQTKKGQEAIEQFNKESDERLHNEFGAEYDGIMNGNKALLKNNGMSEEALKSLEESGVLKNPDLAITLGKLAAKFDDDPVIGHHQTKTVSGLKDQLNDVQTTISEYMAKGQAIPSHIKQKRVDLMTKLGNDL